MKNSLKTIALSIAFLGSSLSAYAEGIAMKPTIEMGIDYQNSWVYQGEKENEEGEGTEYLPLEYLSGTGKIESREGINAHITSKAYSLVWGGAHYKSSAYSFSSSRKESDLKSDSYTVANSIIVPKQAESSIIDKHASKVMIKYNKDLSFGGTFSWIYDYSKITTEGGGTWTAENYYFDFILGGAYQISPMVTIGLEVSPAIYNQTRYKSGSLYSSSYHASGHGLMSTFGVGVHFDESSLGVDYTVGSAYENSKSQALRKVELFGEYQIDETFSLEGTYKNGHYSKTTIDNIFYNEYTDVTYGIGGKKRIDEVVSLAFQYQKNTANYVDEEDSFDQIKKSEGDLYRFSFTFHF